MKIQNSEMTMGAKHFYQEITNIKQSTTTRKKLTSENLEKLQNQQPAVANELDTKDAWGVELSELGLARQATERNRVGNIIDQKVDTLDPKIQMIKSVIEGLTGKKFDIDNTAPLNISTIANQPSTADFAAQMNPFEIVTTDLDLEYSEYQSMSFSAFGSITTADGETFEFSLDFAMERSYSLRYSSSETRIEVPVNLKDPLVLNFNGSSAELMENSKVQFDLDSDGTLDEFSFVGPGSGFLALNTHGDGSVKDGSQLFGTQSGNGFADLAKHDKDGNMWIDENDEIYAQLMIWTMDSSGNQRTMSLKEANVGAIYLGNVNSQYSLKGQGNNTLGEIRNTGVFLTETGDVKTIQHVDIAV